MQSEATAPKGLRTAGIVTAVIALGVIAVGTIGRAGQSDAAQSWSDARAVPVVHLIAATAKDAGGKLTMPGTLQAWNAARLYARVGGYVSAWYKDIGAEVGEGAPLGRIDTPELDQQITQARADLTSARANAALAKSTAARWNDLLSTNSVSRQEADEKNGDYSVKAAAVEAAKANLGRLLALKQFATIRAPFAGLVTTRNADIGDLVGPGAATQQPLFSVADVQRIRVYVSVPQNYAAAMRPGLRATLATPNQPGRTFPAKVVGNAGAINPNTGALQVQLVADNPAEVLKPGGYAEVHFDLPDSPGAVQIPSSALIFRAEGTQVALVDGDRVRLRDVRLGRDNGATVEVIAGLSPNARIVDNPPDSLAAGQQVRVAPSRG
ncbi:efflux RND transporter periplasmic adaptor subunit [Sphingomonas sp.]|uniref:efflux RND transporter periplasmic adaptor subunit n=1 Tax=Sphingomonas sp. TaxID=28214 RepID=UPI003B3A8AE2